MSDALVLDAGVAIEAAPGEKVSGDVALVDRLAEGRVRVLLADGLGHGPAAAEAASQCVDALARAVVDVESLRDAFREVHGVLRGGRGAVAAAVLVDGASREVHAAILGNIVVRIDGARDGRHATTRAVGVPGVLGSAFRNVRVERFGIEAGDLVVVHSDGVRSHFGTLQARPVDARSAAAEILACQGRGRDDASCAIVRVLPPSAVVEASHLPLVREEGRQLPLRRHEDVQVAATAARAYAAEMGLPGRAQWEVGIAASELAQNVIKYGVEGILILRADAEGTLVLEVVDRGPGFGAAEPRPGLREGLNAVQRMMDSCEVHTSPIGTRVVARKKTR